MVLVDPEGILYYNDISDIKGSCNYKVQRKTDDYGYVYAHVFFYQSTVENAFAEVWFRILLSAPHPLTRCLDALLVRWAGSRETLPCIPRIVGLTCCYLPQTEAVNTAQMDGYQYYGTWQELNATQTPAAVTRQSGSNNITVILDPDHPKNFPDFKKAIVPVSGDVNLSLSSIGTLFFFSEYPCQC